MKRMSSGCLALGCWLIVAACGPSSDARSVDEDDRCDDVQPSEPEARVVVEHATLFEVEYRDSFKVVRTRARSDAFGSMTIQEVYVLVGCGAAVPALVGDLAGATVVHTPVRRVSVGNNEELAALLELGLADRVVSVGTPVDSDHAWHPTLKAMIDSGVPVTGTAGSINLETVVDLAPDALFLLTWIGSQQERLETARALGIPAVGQHIWLEPTPLARAEWLKFFAVFLDAESVAGERFAAIEARYSELSAGALARPGKPSVMVATVGGAVTVSANDFLVRYVEDAGGVNVLADAEAPPYTVPFALEELVAVAADTEYWFTSAPDQLDRPELPQTALRAVREGKVVTTHHQEPLSGHDWFGDGVFRVDLVLEDFVSVLHPELLAGHELTYLRRLHP